MNKLKKLMDESKSFSTGQFVWTYSFVGIFPKVIIVLVLATILIILKLTHQTFPEELRFQTDQTIVNDLISGKPVAFFAMGYALLLGPIVETILNQCLVISLVRFFSKKGWIQIGISAVIFALSHFNDATLFALYLGVVLGWCYIVKSKQSIYLAIVTVASIHALVNLFTLFTIQIFSLLRLILNG